MKIFPDRLLIAAVLLALAGCMPNAPYRTVAGTSVPEVCGPSDCTTASIEVNGVPDKPDLHYLLGVVEFDDQGEKFLPAQMDALFARLEAESRTQDLCMVVFVHGWKHNAAYDDPDMQSFRLLLGQLAQTEAAHTPSGGKVREVVGIYAGWRGQVTSAGDLAADLTFWDRKASAARVAQGSIRELLGRARALRDMIDRTTWSGQRLAEDAKPPPGEELRSTRLLTIGHSFGGLIVYTALAQYLTDRAAAADMAGALGNASDADKAIKPYGDLVLIINPAVEATSWEPVHQLVKDRPSGSFARWQNPVFIEVTSSADDATGVAFPLGRSLDTAFQAFTGSAERREANAAIGHYPQFWTHDLTKAADAPTAAEIAAAEASLSGNALLVAECAARRQFNATWRRNGYLQPGWQRQYRAGAVLTHRRESAYDANDPYWVIRTDKDIIADHSDIQEPIFVDFVHQIYDELLLNRTECNIKN